MTRIQTQPGAARAHNGLARAKFRKHKVIMESITQKRKKLRCIVYFESEAPPGYTFISAGNPRFTTVCKEICRKHGLQVFAVTTTPHQNTHGLSQQVHRVGYHFPSTVVARVCMDLGFYVTEKGNVLSIDVSNTASASCQAETEASQAVIDAEARDVIRDLFPNIPADDTDQIVKTAFQKGQRKVGTAAGLPLARRAQLAVVAHIRHIYTDYDQLLKKTSFQEARRKVEDATLEKLVQWRGEDENGKPELEDVFREVIVISDDEDDEDDEHEERHADRPSETGTINRQPSFEILSSNVVTKQLETTHDRDYHQEANSLDCTSVGEPTARFNIVQRLPAQTIPRSKVDRRGFSRYQAWDRAMGRYRERQTMRDHKHDASTRHGESRKVALSQPHSSGSVDERLRRHLVPMEPLSFPRQQAPDILQFPDGSVFSKIPSNLPEGRLPYTASHPPRPLFVAGPSYPPHRHEENPRKRMHPSGILATTKYERNSPPHPSSAVIPSIEQPEFFTTEQSLARSRAGDLPYAQGASYSIPSATRGRPFEDLSRRIDVINLDDEEDDDKSGNLKRRRLDPHESLSSLRRPLSCGSGGLSQIVEKPQSFSRRYVTRVPVEDMYGMSATDREARLLTRGHSEQAHIVVPRTRPSLERPLMEAVREPLGGDSRREDGLYVWDTLFHTARPENSFTSKNNGYVVEPLWTTNRESDRLHRPGPGHGPEGSGWRAKANSYEMQRELINSKDPLQADSGYTVQPHPAWSPPSERHGLGVPQYQVESRMVSRSSKDTVTRDWTPTASRQVYSVRPASQNAVVVTQKRKDTLPISAIRRYEVQLEKSRNFPS